MKKEEHIQYPYTYTVLSGLQITIIVVSLIAVIMNSLNTIYTNNMVRILLLLAMSGPLFSLVGLLIDFLATKKIRHVLFVSAMLLLVIVFLFLKSMN